MNCLLDFFLALALTVFAFLVCAMLFVGIMGVYSYFKNEDQSRP